MKNFDGMRIIKHYRCSFSEHILFVSCNINMHSKYFKIIGLRGCEINLFIAKLS